MIEYLMCDMTFASVRYTALLEDGTIFQKRGFDKQLFEFAIDEG